MLECMDNHDVGRRPVCWYDLGLRVEILTLTLLLEQPCSLEGLFFVCVCVFWRGILT